MLFGETELSIWGAIALLLGGGGVGTAATYIINFWLKRQELKATASKETHATEREVRRDTIKEYQELVERQDKDIARANERNAKMEADYLERMRAIEQRQYISEQREVRCQIRLARAESHIRGLQFLAKKSGMEFRDYEDDDSQLDHEPDGKVTPHGPPPTVEDQPI